MIEWIVTSCVLIAVVILIRFAFRRKLALRVRYALWLAVALRLLVPVTFSESPFSVLNLLPERSLSDEDFNEENLSGEIQGNENLSGAGVGYTAAHMAAQGTAWTAGADNLALGGDMGTAGDRVLNSDYQVPGATGRESEWRPLEKESIFSLTGLVTSQFLLHVWLTGVLVNGALILFVNIGYSRRLRRSRVSFSGELSEYLPRGLAVRLQGRQNRKIYSTPRSKAVLTGSGCLDIHTMKDSGFHSTQSDGVLCAAPDSGYGRHHRSLPDREHNSLRVYVSRAVRTPCLFGFLHPAVYLTPGAVKAPESLHYVLCHESIHYRHRDNLWSLVRTVCLCLHWYNPFVWLAAALSRQDGELACDEETVQWLGEPERLEYGMALLEFCAKEHIPFGSITLTTTMSGGKRKLRERLELIAKQPKKTAGTLAAVVLIVVLLLAVTFTGRRVDQADPLLASAAGQRIGDKESLEDGVSDGDAGPDSTDQTEPEADGTEDMEIIEQVYGYCDYTGYLDECVQWPWLYRLDFMDQDYDGDGLTDRVWREDADDLSAARPIITANYRIEFGNGDVIDIKGMGDGFPLVRSVDLTGDGVPEILFTLSYDYSTDPTADGSMVLYEKGENGYQMMELPGGMVKEPYEQGLYGELKMYEPTLTYHFEQAGNYGLRITCLETAMEAPLDVTVTFDQETWDQLGYGYNYPGKEYEKAVWKVEFEEREGELPRLLLHTGMMDKYCADDVVLILAYRNGALHMEDIQYYHVYDQRVPIDMGDGKTYELAVHGKTLLGSGLYQTDSVWRVWVHDNVGEWIEEIDFSEAGRDFTGGIIPQLEAYSPDGGIRLLDLNFDGAQDFCIQSWVGSHNTPYYCFVWNKETEQFEYVGFVPNVELDQENRRIVSSTVDGGGQYSTSYYYLDEENRLVLERWVMEDLSPSAVLDSLDLTYVETSSSLPAIDDWDYGVYGGGLQGKMLYWAKRALTELYQWTGIKVDTAYFTVTEFGDIYFAKSAGELTVDYFYSRSGTGYGEAAGFLEGIQHVILHWNQDPWSWSTSHPVPEGMERMSDEEIVSWYFDQWAAAAGNGESVEEIEENMKDVAGMRNFVIRAESGNYYEVTYYSDDLTKVNCIFGPYPDYPRH